MRSRALTKSFFWMAALIGATGGFHSSLGQEIDQSKGLKAEEFIKSRPAASPARRSVLRTYRRRTPKSVATKTDTPDMTFADLGVTLWRLRPTVAADKTKELVLVQTDVRKEFTLERIELGTPLPIGTRVRFTVESLSTAGYLYIIDREQYADGTLADPVLIYPYQETGNANYVKAGCLINTPQPGFAFEIRPTKGAKEHVGESITILVSPTRLVDPQQLGVGKTELRREQLELWQKSYGAITEELELDDGIGAVMTVAEQDAADCSRGLTQDDPGPQTIFHMLTKRTNPLLVSFSLKFARQ